MEIIFLGTGAGKPSNRRNVSSLILNLAAEAGEYWLFDCGEATQHQMMRAPISPHRVSKVFITHLHGDHVFGLPGLLTSRSMVEKAPPLEVYGPTGIKELLETIMRLTQSYMTYDLTIHEIQTGVIFESQQFKVKTQKLRHRVPSFGFRIEEADKPGKLDMKKLRAEGISTGSVLKKLKKGEQVQLEDGRVIHGKDYVGVSAAGKIVAILGDTQPCTNACELAYQADVLVHEATFGNAFEKYARMRGHSTAREAAQVAKDSNVKQLILTHISQRYSEGDEESLLRECRDIFPSVKISHDLECFTVL